MGKRKEVRLRKLSPSDPAARDEGPRLLPFPVRPRSDEAYFARYLALADLALKNGPSADDSGDDAPPARLKPPRLMLPKPPKAPKRPMMLTAPKPPRPPNFPKPKALQVPKLRRKG